MVRRFSHVLIFFRLYRSTVRQPLGIVRDRLSRLFGRWQPRLCQQDTVTSLVACRVRSRLRVTQPCWCLPCVWCLSISFSVRSMRVSSYRWLLSFRCHSVLLAVSCLPRCSVSRIISTCRRGSLC